MIFQRFLRFSACFITLSLVFILCLPLSAAADEDASIILTFTGDCTLGGEDRLKNKEYAFVSFVNKHGFAYPFGKVKTLFEQDDLTIINLENVFYDAEDNRSEKTYTFRSPVSFAEILPAGSVEVAFIGNNHILDYGEPGMRSTVAALENEGIAWFGNTTVTPAHYIYEKDGMKIGFAGAYLSHWLTYTDELRQTMQELQDEGCDVIIGIMHGGVEYSRIRSQKQERMAAWLVKYGADLVIGHHPHLPQGIDRIGHASVVYSLGNFSFGGNNSLNVSRREGIRADSALLARVELRFDENKKYLGHQLNLIPVSPSGTSEYNNYQPVLQTGEDALKTIKLVQRDTQFQLAPYVEGVGALQDFVPYSTNLQALD